MTRLTNAIRELAQKLEQIKDFGPYVAGLAKGGATVIAMSPPHVATVCGFSVRVPKKTVASLLIKGSYLATWLK